MIDYAKFDNSIGLNWYEIDPNLRQIMRRMLEAADLACYEPDLERVGALCGGAIAARAVVTDKHPPELVKFDHWGEQIDQVRHHPGALATKRDLWEAGVSGSRLHEEAVRRGRRLPQAVPTALNYMLSQAEIGMLCATGMTNGVIGLVKRFAPPDVQKRFLPHLTAPNFDDAWDGAMFMTEKTGGSDLGTLTTVARRDGERWSLTGSKWFCSNVDAGAIVTLARPEGAGEGLRGVALFLVPKHRSDGSRNGINVRRIKDKLGTRAVPTAEADFADAEAYLLAGDGAAGDGRGINRMMEMVNDSRRGVAVMGLGIMRRSFLESAIFAAHRTAFGHSLRELPMMRETLVGMVVELEAAAALVFASAADESAVSRLLVPIAKLRATRRGVEMASQAVEIHGGNGYIEDWPTARLLRDAQSNTIWEGTENIICLDILRALHSEQVMEAGFAALRARADCATAALAPIAQSVTEELKNLREALGFLSRADRDLRQLRARSFGNYFADVAAAALLLEEANWELTNHGNARKAVIAHLFVQTHLRPRPLRGITSGDRTMLDLFEPITGYGEIEPKRAAAAIRSA
ncbi:MAG TPA: acyl-CoA dehydrogenase family protein [Candidatus Binataceae bacterium]|nr:acyl-CoA dehydrogenase family protein [Candidatus Binataceae bacterium]